MAFRIVRPVQAAFCALGSVLFVVSHAGAQDLSSGTPGADLASSQTEGLQDIGRTAETGTGEVGQRLRRGDIAVNTAPMARINNRIENRVENRLNSRVDSAGYRASDATSSFKIATARSRETPLSSEATAIAKEDEAPR